MEIPPAVPVMTLPSATLFPQALLPLYIFEPRYRRMLADALRAGRMFSVAMQRPDRKREAPCAVAGLGLIRVSVDHRDGTSHLILQGLARVELGDSVQQKPYRVHAIRPLEAAPADSLALDALVSRVHELVEQRLKHGSLPPPFPVAKPKGKPKAPGEADTPYSPAELLRYLRNVSDAGQLADLVTCALLPEAGQRQAILEAVDVEPRVRRLISFLLAEMGSSANTVN